MPITKIITRTRNSITNDFYSYNEKNQKTFEDHIQKNYLQSGKIISSNTVYYDASNNVIGYVTPTENTANWSEYSANALKVVLILVFDTEESYNQHNNDPLKVYMTNKRKSSEISDGITMTVEKVIT